MQKIHTASRSRKSSKHNDFSVAPSERLFVGVDVHKRSYHVALWSDERGLITTWVQPAAPAALCDRLAPQKCQIVQVVYEAGPTGYTLVRVLRASGLAALDIVKQATDVD